MSAALVNVPEITVEEFLRRPERTDGMQEELIDGEIVVSPNAKPVHNYVASRIFVALLPLEERGTYYVMGEVACRLTNKSLPNTDACVYLADVYDRAMDVDEYPVVSPVLAVEVASPSNRRMHTKADLYLAGGAGQVWLVYPQSRTVTVLRPLEEPYTAGAEDSLQFDLLNIPVASFFRRRQE